MTVTLIAIGVAAAAVIIALIILMQSRKGDAHTAVLDQRFDQVAQTLERVTAAQAELSGRLQQAQLGTDQRLDAMTKRLGDGMTQQTEKTGVTLKALNERLAVIDAAQKNISDLSTQMVGLQDILSNKQARGAFGELQLNDLVTSILPPSAYAFQVTMSNGSRADCLLQLPNPPGPIVIDSKFPLESYHAVRNASTDVEEAAAFKAFGRDILKHVNDIANKYILPGETADSAMMFLPSEAVYAELHASMPEVVEKSYRAKVWIVSPTTMMATLNTVRAVLKDVRMREQAGVIQGEVRIMMEDVARLDDRVDKLQRHFGQAEEDIRQVRISADKVVKRGDRIEEIEMGEGADTEELEPVTPPAQPRLVGE